MTGSIMHLRNAIELTQNVIKNRILNELECRTISSRYDIAGYKRIYHVHIRKTGGTSLNHIFLGLSGENSASLYERLSQKPDHRLISHNKIFVGWNVRYIQGGKYFYAFSHTPLHTLNLPEKTFLVTCFRDPVQRVISHYNMLKDYQTNNINHPCMSDEGKWLGNSFDDFLERIPREHLCNQLYMFSRQFDIEEALGRTGKLSHIMFTENFSDDLNKLNDKLGLRLNSVHIRKSAYKADIPQKALDHLREKLNDEYIFLNEIQEKINVHNL